MQAEGTQRGGPARSVLLAKHRLGSLWPCPKCGLHHVCGTGRRREVPDHWTAFSQCVAPAGGQTEGRSSSSCRPRPGWAVEVTARGRVADLSGRDHRLGSPLLFQGSEVAPAPGTRQATGVGWHHTTHRRMSTVLTTGLFSGSASLSSFLYPS